MVPMILWVSSLIVASALALRAVTQGGPVSDALWVMLGLAALVTFGGALWGAFPQLVEAVAQERIWAPNPVVRVETIVLGMVVFFRPHRRRQAATR